MKITCSSTTIPLPPPPEDLDYIRDINTGLAYTETWKKLIGKPGTKKVLLPVIMYLDGAVTGQFDNLPIEALKFTFGIFTRKARDRAWMWRTFGYVPQVSKARTQGEKMFMESGHMDTYLMGKESASNAQDSDVDDEGSEANDAESVNSRSNKEEEKLETVENEEEELVVKIPEVAAQDFHSILSVLLEPMVNIQEHGFLWDLNYKGQLYKDVHFIPFVPFIRCDTAEADKLTGSYSNRNKHVKQLCRYCTCPTDESDNHNWVLNRSRMKTQEKIQKLVDEENLDALKKMSQQYIHNAWYAIRFGLHNDQGIHGACPLDMLHALCLGIFKYCRDCFFEQIGKVGQFSDKINALAQEYGTLLNRQSERDRPRSKFKKGIREGKLMGKEYIGVLLNMAMTLRSTEGKKLLQEGKKRYFGDAYAQDYKIKDWIMLVETLIQWEAWLKQDSYSKSSLKRCKRKHRYIMYLLKKVAKRKKGMSFKVIKFHAILHMADDMLNFGTAMEIDTGTCESGHKDPKEAAQHTQKNPVNFTDQTHTRLVERHACVMAKEEEKGNKLWEYYDKKCVATPNKNEAKSEDTEDEASETTTNIDKNEAESKDTEDEASESTTDIETEVGGTQIRVYYDEEANRPAFELLGATPKMKANAKIPRALIKFLWRLNQFVVAKVPSMGSINIRTKHKRGDTIFRAHPYFQGGPWHDWAMFYWGRDYGNLPGHISCFVDLSELHGAIGVFADVQVENSVYAVIESGTFNANLAHLSDVLVPITKEVERLENGAFKRRFYLADVESIVGTLAVVPDIGGNPNEYFQVKPRSEWAGSFETWLHQQYEEMDD